MATEYKTIIHHDSQNQELLQLTAENFFFSCLFMTIRQKVFFGAQVIDAPWWASSPATTYSAHWISMFLYMCSRFLDRTFCRTFLHEIIKFSLVNCENLTLKIDLRAIS